MTKTRFQRILACCLLVIFWGLAPGWRQAGAEPILQPGFRTLGLWDAKQHLRLDFAVWYPCSRTPAKVTYGDWTFSVARGASPLPGRHPLILLAHDSSGGRFSLHALAGALARRGFVVASFTAPGDNEGDMQLLFTLRQMTDRARQLRQGLDMLLQQSDIAGFVDTSRIGVLGVGSGGAAALLLAGAIPDPGQWKGYCMEQQKSGMFEDPYCSPWARQRMDILAVQPRPKESLQDPRIRALAVAAPWYTTLFTRDSLRGVRIPVLLVGTEKSYLSPLAHAERLRSAFAAAPEWQVLSEANAVTLSSACGEDVVETFPELCRPHPLRGSVQHDLAEGAAAFFLEQIGRNDTLQEASGVQPEAGSQTAEKAPAPDSGQPRVGPPPPLDNTNAIASPVQASRKQNFSRNAR